MYTIRNNLLNGMILLRYSTCTVKYHESSRHVLHECLGTSAMRRLDDE